MDLHLHEAVLLLNIDDEKGSFSNHGYINYAFASALITDLLVTERVAVEDNRIHLKTNAITDSRALNAVIDQVSRRKKPMKVSNWIHTLVERSSKLYELSLEKLIRDGILREERGRILWIFNVDRYPTVDAKPEQDLRQRLRALMLDESTTPDRKERLLLSIILHCELIIEVVKEKADRKKAKKRLKSLTETSLMDEHIGHTINEMQAAVMVATTVVIS